MPGPRWRCRAIPPLGEPRGVRGEQEAGQDQVVRRVRGAGRRPSQVLQDGAEGVPDPNLVVNARPPISPARSFWALLTHPGVLFHNQVARVAF